MGCGRTARAGVMDATRTRLLTRVLAAVTPARADVERCAVMTNPESRGDERCRPGRRRAASARRDTGDRGATTVRSGRDSDPDSRWMLGLCHRVYATHSIAIFYSCSCNLFPSSCPSFAIRCPRALKTLCGRLEIVDRRDDYALIRRRGAPSSRLPLSPNDDRASASDAYAWRADSGTREPNRRAGRACTSSAVRACSVAGAEPHATLKRRESNPFARVSVTD